MNNIGLEYYYLSGKNIPLNNNLGTIRQLTLNDFIDLNTDINEFIQPFILNKKIMQFMHYFSIYKIPIQPSPQWLLIVHPALVS